MGEMLRAPAHMLAPDVVTSELVWHPDSLSPPLAIDLPRLFAAVTR
jgi:hypothetical protein